jgi:hypothetical protein
VAERTEDFARVLIFGNSGSGKSWLSRELGERLKIAPIDLDTVHWEPGGVQVPRDNEVARAIVRQIASHDIWIMKGVYGWLAQEILSRATALIWLDMPMEDCLDNLRSRGPNPGSDEKSFAALLAPDFKLVDGPRAPFHGVPRLEEAHMFAPGERGFPRRDQADLTFPYCLGVILLSEPNVFNRLSFPPHGRLSF